ncbi:MAG TPA: zf-HC2 domain-containing protein, partial [Thermoanaerobaculia bacterium]|nr:zf-HC2 domain-containing protein [Thermoanaerobaculia bacterium]
MECRELTQYALDRLLGEADGGRLEDLDAHLEGCDACRAELAAIEETWEILGTDRDAPVTPEFRARTIELLENEVARQRIRAFRPRSRVLRIL